MQEITGDLWDYRKSGWIVIPTNQVAQKDGVAAMGLGVAGQARDLYPGIDRVLHSLLTMQRTDAPQLYCAYATGEPIGGGLIFFPTKAHWKEKASLKFIEKGLTALVDLPIYGNVYLPLLGVGYGLLYEEDVLPQMRAVLISPKFTLVRRGKDVVGKYPASFRETRSPNNRSGYVDYSLHRERENERS